MSAVSIKRPVLNLPKLLREPGGLPLVEAVASARQNLDAASAGYLADLAKGVAEIAALAAGKTAGYDAAAYGAMYQRAGALIGVASVCGRPSIDDALVSFCDLLDQLRVRETGDTEAIQVHVNALRLLLLSPQLEGQAAATAVLDGLHRVSRRYKPDDED